MKNSIYKIVMGCGFLLSITLAQGQVKNAKTETVKIMGNCGMCKATIEKAGNQSKIAALSWDKDSKIATIIFDSTQTNQAQILKRVALAGYDSQSFLAPTDAYNKLPGCCQYERELKVAEKTEIKMGDQKNEEQHDSEVSTSKEEQLNPVFDAYFSLHEALVQSDSKKTATIAADLFQKLNAVKMEALSMKVHMAWMKVMIELKEDAEHIAGTQDIKHQRDHFATLSTKMYELVKVSNLTVPVYYNACPMYNKGAAANWLSKEEPIKNPFYGAKMLSCGSTLEILK